MFHYYVSEVMTLTLYSIIAFLILCLVSMKKLSINIGIIINIIVWYTVLNFFIRFPWFKIGTMDWTGKLLVIFVIVVIMIYKKHKNEEGFVYFTFENKNKSILIITSIMYLIVITVSLCLLLFYGIFNIEVFLSYIILIGISEELFFRGFIYKKILGIKNAWENKKYIPIIVCSLLFCITHLSFFHLSFMENIRALIFPFLGGIIFNYLYEKSRNIMVPIMVHNIFNTFYYTVWVILNVYNFDIGGI